MVWQCLLSKQARPALKAQGTLLPADGLLWVDRNGVRGSGNCWGVSSLYEENLSEGDELTEWSPGWKFCYRDLLKLGQ